MRQTGRCPRRQGREARVPWPPGNVGDSPRVRLQVGSHLRAQSCDESRLCSPIQAAWREEPLDPLLDLGDVGDAGGAALCVSVSHGSLRTMQSPGPSWVASGPVGLQQGPGTCPGVTSQHRCPRWSLVLTLRVARPWSQGPRETLGCTPATLGLWG